MCIATTMVRKEDEIQGNLVMGGGYLCGWIGMVQLSQSSHDLAKP